MTTPNQEHEQDAISTTKSTQAPQQSTTEVVFPHELICNSIAKRKAYHIAAANARQKRRVIVSSIRRQQRQSLVQSKNAQRTDHASNDVIDSNCSPILV